MRGIFAHVAEHVFQFGRLLFGQAHIAVFTLAEQRHFAGFFLVCQHQRVFARVWNVRQAQDFHGDGRAGFVNGFAVFVQHGAHFTERRAGQQHIAFFQCAALHQQGGHRAASFVQTGFHDNAFGRRVHRSFQFQHFGFQQHGFQQFVDIQTLFGRYIDKLHVAAPFVAHHFMLGQLLADAFGIGGILIDFVHGHHHRHAGGFGMGNRFHGLRHHAVVGGHHQNHDVGGLRAARTHGGKGFVAGGVEEGNDAARGLHMVGTDVLGNAARFALHHFGAADVVKQRGFTVVDVTHHGNNGRTRQCFGIALRGAVFQEGFGVVGGGRLADVAEFFHHNQRGILVERLVDGYHHAHLHQGLDHFHAFHRHFVRQIGYGDGFRHKNFVHDGFGGCLEAVLVGLEFEFFAFFAAAHALVVASGVAVAPALAAFAFGVAALAFVVAVVATLVFFTAAACAVVGRCGGGFGWLGGCG